MHGQGNVPRSVAQEVESKKREAEALRLRAAGAPYSRIAEQLGFSSAAGAYKAFRRGVNRLGAEEAREALFLANERYQAMLLRVWPQAMEGDQAAIECALVILDRIERLHGLDHASARC